MIRTVLLDLDDTLLENKMEQFLPAYFKLLGDYLAHHADTEKMLQELIAGTQAMIANLDPRLTLEQVFSKHFYPALGLDASEMAGTIEGFYKTEFPRLREHTRSFPAVPGVVDELLAEGYEVVIATNPLFPRLAIEERLRWAGLPPEDVNFTLIASFEDSHFAKPNPEYFAEILARLGRKPAEAVMVGDDLERDIHPAAALGMAVYYIGEESNSGQVGAGLSKVDNQAAALGLAVDRAGEIPDPCIASGPLTGLPLVLKSGLAAEETLKSAPTHILLARLRAVLAATLEACADLPAGAWRSRPVENEWAPVEIVAHLRDVEREVNLPRLEAVLSRNDPHLPAFDTDRWASERAYLEQDGPETLDDFSQARMETIARLSALDLNAWERAARHTLLGPTTLHELMKIATEHDWLHMAQLRETLEALEIQHPG